MRIEKAYFYIRNMHKSSHKKIFIYQDPYGKPCLNIKLENKDLWLSTNELSELFKASEKQINTVLDKLFDTGECDEKECKRKEGKINFYNLDVLLSLAYKLDGSSAIHFRKWATRVLKEHLALGYSTNESRLAELQLSYKLYSIALNPNEKRSDEDREIQTLLNDYSYALKVLDDYDYQRESIDDIENNILYEIDFFDAIKAIYQLKFQYGGTKLFGNEKDASFQSTLGAINQTFDGNDLYPSIEEKAANLLYLVVKNHSFSDGNKRIAAWVFIWFLEKNQLLYSKNGEKRIANNTLIALTLMIATSLPEEKEMMIKTVVNLLKNHI